MTIHFFYLAVDNIRKVTVMREKFQLEFILNVSHGMLYNYISSPTSLSEWFTDDVNVRGEKYRFIWNGNEETTVLIQRK